MLWTTPWFLPVLSVELWPHTVFLQISISHHHHACTVMTKHFESKNPPSLTEDKMFNKHLGSNEAGTAMAQACPSPTCLSRNAAFLQNCPPYLRAVAPAPHPCPALRLLCAQMNGTDPCAGMLLLNKANKTFDSLRGSFPIPLHAWSSGLPSFASSPLHCMMLF